MAPQSTEGDTLELLQTPEQVALLDAIDELRCQGIEHHGIDLPQLVVCGEQSTGKSSLLEGLTRLRFPMKESLGTTFATEVVLRRANTTKISCSIMPCDKRAPGQQHELSKFEHVFSSREDFSFPSVIEEAKDLMAQGSSVGRNSIFKDVLRVKYSGPDVPSLTIVDLPGMIEEDFNGGGGANKIADLVASYMSKPKSIILAVVMAGNDPENQKPFKYIRKYDPERSRTLGVITKPDKVDQGSESEKDLLRLARNEKCKLTHGWFAVRNRCFNTRDHSDVERDEMEKSFFSSGLWASHPRSHVGIAALRTKLSKMLLEHISMELPSLVTAIQGAIASTQSSLEALGSTRETTREQRIYLTKHAVRFQTLTNDALRGIYSDRFFNVAGPDEQAPTRLRTAIQNLNIAFAQVMYQKGHTWAITADATHNDVPTSFLGESYPSDWQYHDWFELPKSITRAHFLENHIGVSVRQSRPQGLPSLVNPWVIGQVFREQSQNWSEIAKHHLQQVFKAMKLYVEEAIGSSVDPRTRNLLMLRQVQPELDRRWRTVEAKLEELLVPYTEQEPITYDPGFLRDLEQLRASRYQRKLDSQNKGVPHPFAFGQTSTSHATSTSSQRLLTESLDDFTNSEILDLMQTYYKSAISVFINNTAVLAIENCLIKDLSAIFSPTLTADMDDEQLQAIAAESEDVRCERDTLRKKLEVLQSGKRILYEHIAMRPITRTLAPKQTKETGPHTPVPQVQQEAAGITEEAFQRKMNGSISKLNGLAVTPPPSGPNSRQPSRGRHDSIHGTPAFTGSAKKPSPRRWAPPVPVDLFGPEAQAESDGEL
ncbi:hypothetical protein HBH70_134870 [Parastagonospora nodorum]|nr:hypothetical protein HBH51_127230 [Parastagonospora nodorum]KAH4076752.1 hypothetical protein HBH50_009860 [Parastagonospora nodorum]KAH4095766.1 hypothetical protein HBH48_047920 [Parastagonospora nodorum]KAH4911494.1 hypothetical protein HBI80_022620 [Parastagonospora nodorum]KAH5052373.1 hypothetical protein HBH96_164590 [Parastagonospora nodorum]